MLHQGGPRDVANRYLSQLTEGSHIGTYAAASGHMARKAAKSKTPTMLRLNMKIEAELLDDLDDFRSGQPGIIPNRSETIRALLRWALKRHPKTTPLKDE
jgi:hypothetical protein